jgi:hypothetical protein
MGAGAAGTGWVVTAGMAVTGWLAGAGLLTAWATGAGAAGTG